MAKKLSVGSEWIWLSTADPGLSETGVYVGNFWRNTTSGDLFNCSDATIGFQVWQKYPVVPVTVPNGGTGDTSVTAYAPICGGTTTTGAFQSASTGIGTSGFILTSTGNASLPTFQAPAASSISITGDTGGALTGNSFTFTGGTTGLSFGGSGSTETVSGTLVVANGGTGATSLVGILTGNSTSAITANAVTQHGVLLGGASNAVSSLGVASTGTVLMGVTGSDPAFSTATYPSTTGANTFLTSITQDTITTTTFIDNTAFTPAINFSGGTTGIMYTTQRGYYSRIGNRVFFTINILLSSKGSSTGDLQITGFPVATTSQGSDNVASTLLVDISFPANTVDTFLIMNASDTTANVYITKSNGDLVAIDDSNCSDTSSIRVAGQYFVT